MKKYPSIEQFRNVIRDVRQSHDFKGKDEDGKVIYQHTDDYPVLKFKGTVKLHGTNSGIVKYADGHLEFQSRERVLSLNEDNAGFMTEMVTKDLETLFSNLEFNDFAAIYGEWCGGNIQKGVAINGLPKMFVIFGILVDDVWIEIPKDLHLNEIGIYNISQFPTYEIDIDFNTPEIIQNKLIEMTIDVENSCPVGLFFGKEGIGEGIVFACETKPYLRFKSKGEKHSATKVKKLNSVNVEEIESINEFVDAACSENRLKQGISYFNENGLEVDAKNTGDFLRWVVNDVLKEEKDTIIENSLDENKIKKSIAIKARMWFMAQF